ncbi:hypothetical protein Nm8I071_01510 [Nonomuraea sp. TT08I-71]|nr:hypothetical protein Nm8I071_01510 [Nonomuraea sp. TT08I-71]
MGAHRPALRQRLDVGPGRQRLLRLRRGHPHRERLLHPLRPGPAPPVQRGQHLHRDAGQQQPTGRLDQLDLRQFYNGRQVGVASTADGSSIQNYGSVAYNRSWITSVAGV